MNDESRDFADLSDLATHLREALAPAAASAIRPPGAALVFALGGVGKTRLAQAFTARGQEAGAPDTLLFNTDVEDLFSWAITPETAEPVLRFEPGAPFFAGLAELDMEDRIRPLLRRYVDFDFLIDYERGVAQFWRETVRNDQGLDVPVFIKISRGEENLFIWCFFLAVAQLAIDGQEAYDWVRYIWIDDPVWALDEYTAITMAAHLARILNDQERVKAVISTRHPLFFEVMGNNLEAALRFFLAREGAGWRLRDTGRGPSLHHVAVLRLLWDVAQSGELYTWHLTLLRSVLEKTAVFHGFSHFGQVIRREPDDEDGALHLREVEILAHDAYPMFEPVEMTAENKELFRKILRNFMDDYRFNPELFPVDEAKETAA